MTVDQVIELNELVRKIGNQEKAVSHFESLIAEGKKKGITSINGHVTKYEADIEEAINLTLYHYKKELASLQKALENFETKRDVGEAFIGGIIREEESDSCTCATPEITLCQGFINRAFKIAAAGTGDAGALFAK